MQSSKPLVQSDTSIPLTYLVRGESMNDVYSVVADVALGAALVGIHWLGTLDEGGQEVLVKDTEPFP